MPPYQPMGGTSTKRRDEASRALRHETVLHRIGDQLRVVLQRQLLQDPGPVCADRLDAEGKLLRDVARRDARGHQTHHGKLAVGQRFVRWARRFDAHVGSDLRGHSRTEIFLAWRPLYEVGMRTVTRVPRRPPEIVTLPPNDCARSCIPTIPNDFRPDSSSVLMPRPSSAMEMTAASPLIRWLMRTFDALAWRIAFVMASCTIRKIAVPLLGSGSLLNPCSTTWHRMPARSCTSCASHSIAAQRPRLSRRLGRRSLQSRRIASLAASMRRMTAALRRPGGAISESAEMDGSASSIRIAVSAAPSSS